MTSLPMETGWLPPLTRVGSPLLRKPFLPSGGAAWQRSAFHREGKQTTSKRHPQCRIYRDEQLIRNVCSESLSGVVSLPLVSPPETSTPRGRSSVAPTTLTPATSNCANSEPTVGERGGVYSGRGLGSEWQLTLGVFVFRFLFFPCRDKCVPGDIYSFVYSDGAGGLRQHDSKNIAMRNRRKALIQ